MVNICTLSNYASILCIEKLMRSILPWEWRWQTEKDSLSLDVDRTQSTSWTVSKLQRREVFSPRYKVGEWCVA
jgi:hypothetical protein